MRKVNYWTPLQALDEDEDAENANNTDTQVQNTKKEFISPIKVLSHNCDSFHKMFKQAGITKYCIKKISIGIKIICETKDAFNMIVSILKDHSYQFFTHESKHDKPFKFVLFGLDGKSTDEVKNQLISLKYNCTDVKKVEKTYNEYVDTLYIVYFKNGTVKLRDLKQNVKSLFHMIIRWDYQRKIKNKPIQCHNCQMFGHGEKGCSIKTKCAHCSGRHKTTDCKNKDKVKCANCNNTHAATDSSCPLREQFINIRENIQRKNNRYPTHSKRINQNRKNNIINNFNTLENDDFPLLPNFNTSYENNRMVWPNSQTQVNFKRNTTQSTNELFTVEEISQLTLDIVSKLKSCKTKDEQFYVITQLATKYLYNI